MGDVGKEVGGWERRETGLSREKEKASGNILLSLATRVDSHSHTTRQLMSQQAAIQGIYQKDEGKKLHVYDHHKTLSRHYHFHKPLHSFESW